MANNELMMLMACRHAVVSKIEEGDSTFAHRNDEDEWETVPCEDKLAIERYQDLIDYFSDKDIAKEILEDREEFKKWLDRMRWHVRKADEFARKLNQEPCEDAVSRQAALDELRTCFDTHSIYDENNGENYIIYEDAVDMMEKLPPVTPKRKIGKWVIDDEEHGRIWHCHCSNCKKDPQDYIGGTENWWLVRLPDYCPNCGAEMRGAEL